MQSISPFFIVSDVGRSIAFYRNDLGFEVTFREPERSPFFAIVARDEVQIFLKSDPSVSALPNKRRHPFMKWDAYVYSPNPEALADELSQRGATLSVPLSNTGDGLRGFEICDPDGYVLFFGGPQDNVA